MPQRGDDMWLALYPAWQEDAGQAPPSCGGGCYSAEVTCFQPGNRRYPGNGRSRDAAGPIQICTASDVQGNSHSSGLQSLSASAEEIASNSASPFSGVAASGLPITPDAERL